MESFWKLCLGYLSINLQANTRRSLLKKVWSIGDLTNKIDIYIQGDQRMKRKSYKEIIENLNMRSHRDITFNSLGNLRNKDITPFLSVLSKILPFWISQIDIQNFIIKRKDLQLIINSSLKWSVLKFYWCKLDFEEITISGKARSNIKVLNFFGSWKKTRATGLNIPID